MAYPKKELSRAENGKYIETCLAIRDARKIVLATIDGIKNLTKIYLREYLDDLPSIIDLVENGPDAESEASPLSPKADAIKNSEVYRKGGEALAALTELLRNKSKVIKGHKLLTIIKDCADVISRSEKAPVTLQDLKLAEDLLNEYQRTNTDVTRKYLTVLHVLEDASWPVTLREFKSLRDEFHKRGSPQWSRQEERLFLLAALPDLPMRVQNFNP